MTQFYVKIQVEIEKLLDAKYVPLFFNK